MLLSHGSGAGLRAVQGALSDASRGVEDTDISTSYG
jgi:hypothetical protein